jgi:hypothetical protein
MANGFYWGLGISVTFFFVRYAVPAMPRIVAWAGVLAGIVVMLAEMLNPAMKPPLSSVALFVIGVLCLGGATHLYVHRNDAKQAEKPGAAQDAGNNGNQMGDVDNNKGVITQGQRGNNTISK